MTARELQHLKAGYLRGLMGVPLEVKDVGLSREELIEKYISYFQQEQLTPKGRAPHEQR